MDKSNRRKIYLGHSEACGIIIPTPHPRMLPGGPHLCLQDSVLTANSSGAGTMLIYLYIPQSLALKYYGHSVNFY